LLHLRGRKGLTFAKPEEVNDDSRGIQLLMHSEAVLTHDVSVSALWDKIKGIVNKDEESYQKYAALLKSIVFVVSKEDYDRLSDLTQMQIPDSKETGDKMDDMLAMLEFWGGIERQEALLAIGGDDPDDFNKLCMKLLRRIK